MSLIGNIETDVKDFVSRIATDAENEFRKLVDLKSDAINDIVEARTVANNLVNAFKQYVANPVEKEIEQVILDVVPAKWVAAIKSALPKLMVDLKWVAEDFYKAPADLLKIGLMTAVNTTGDIKATNMAVLQAHINTQLSTAAGSPVPIQTSLTQADSVYKASQEPPVVNA